MRKPNKMTFSEMNRLVMTLTDEKEVLRLLKEEKARYHRPLWMQRIFSRYSRLRSKREREEMTA
jgi:hypothetical protein